MWRFIPRFLLQQRLRDRLIDNAMKGKQNRFTQCPETIFTITLDWLGVALKCLENVRKAMPRMHSASFPRMV